MIDWHSHVLSGMDDGSKSVAESVQLLKELRAQGVDTVIATPHYYADDESVESFLQRREESYQSLCAQVEDLSKISGNGDLPKIVLGTEVCYYPAIRRLERLLDLRIGQSDLLLLEMPSRKWSEYTLREIEEISEIRGVTLILAHIERSFPFQSPKTLERLYESRILMQSNAGFFTALGTRSKALRLLRDGKVHLIGSDCHNTTSRPPRMEKAFHVISKKFGEHFITQMNEFGQTLLVKE
ncbi:MAG: hypothetical protein J6B54_02175 [Clostridia bacterium]|nr:hypothetical protein [Clostridia bacterium]